MGKKIQQQDLAELLATRMNLSNEEGLDFIKSFFSLIEEGLLQDRFVKITNFGTKKIVEVNERKSVSVQSGESIQIGGHSKISFAPDPFLRELVNRPFAHFSTITLNEDTDIEEFDAVDLAEQNNAVEEIVQQESCMTEVDPELSVSDAPGALPNRGDDVVPSPEATIDENSSAYGRLETSVALGTNTPNNPQQHVVDATSPSIEDNVSEDRDATSLNYAEPSTRPPVENPDEKRAECEENDNDRSGEPLIVDEGELDVKLSKRSDEQITHLNGTILIKSEQKRKRSFARVFLRCLFWIVCVLSLMCGAYWLGYRHFLDHTVLMGASVSADSVRKMKQSSGSETITNLDASGVPIYDEDVINSVAIPAESAAKAMVEKANRDAARHDSLAAKAKKEAKKAAEVVEKISEITQKKTEQSVASKATASVSDNANAISKKTPSLKEKNLVESQSQSSRPKQYVVKKGENIYQIAAKVYGNRSFAPKLIQYNKLSTPNHIEEGQVLNLPDLK